MTVISEYGERMMVCRKEGTLMGMGCRIWDDREGKKNLGLARRAGSSWKVRDMSTYDKSCRRKEPLSIPLLLFEIFKEMHLCTLQNHIA